MTPVRYTNLPAARARFGDKVDRLAPFFYKLDPAADACIEAMDHHPGSWPMVTRALSHGASSVKELPPAFRALLDAVDHVPAWVDWETLDRGGALLMRSGPLAGLVLGAKSLPHGYASPGGNKPLVFSGRLTEQAARRLNETSRFVQAVCRPGGMRRFGDGFQITVKVRLMHAQVRRMLLRSGRWDETRWGAPINQHDMSATTLLFSYSVLEGLRTFGLRIAPDEAESFIQLWRYVGHVIGADPELTPASEFEAHQLAELVGMTMGEPDDDSRALVKALLHSPFEGCKSELERAMALRRSRLGGGLCRGLVGDELADKLAVPRDVYRFAVPAIRAFVSKTERVRQAFPAAERAAIEVGTRYWDRVVQVGLAGATAEFGLPEKLAVTSPA